MHCLDLVKSVGALENKDCEERESVRCGTKEQCSPPSIQTPHRYMQFVECHTPSPHIFSMPPPPPHSPTFHIEYIHGLLIEAAEESWTTSSHRFAMAILGRGTLAHSFRMDKNIKLLVENLLAKQKHDILPGGRMR